MADVNGDGKPDLLVANDCADNFCDGSVGVLLGKGDGTFQPAVTYISGGMQAWGLGVADVNGDGKPDLLVTNIDSGTVGVLLGNGDGTFQPVVTYDSGGFPDALAVADVNGDSKLDLLVANQSATVGVLLGNGDGTFQSAVTYGSGGYTPFSVAVADVNADGKPDMVVANACPSSGCPGDGSVGVLLGNGDGTFQPAVTYDVGGIISDGALVADVNGDGKPDIVAISCGNFCSGSGLVTLLLGNGDGTFQPAVSYDSGGSQPRALAVADVDRNGEPDVIVAHTCLTGDNICPGDGVVGVLLHVGAKLTTTALVSAPNPSVFGQTVTLTATVSSPSGTPTGTVVFFDGSAALGSATLVNKKAPFSVSALTVGSHSITAVYQGSAKFNSSASTVRNQVVNIATTATSLASSQNPAVVTESVTYTATVASQYGGAATGTVMFQDGAATIATVTVVGSGAACSTKYSTPGAHSITATYSGDANNSGSVSSVLTEQINRGFPSKTVLTTSGSPSFVGQQVTFTATVASINGTIPDGEPVTFYDFTTAIGTGTIARSVVRSGRDCAGVATAPPWRRTRLAPSK